MRRSCAEGRRVPFKASMAEFLSLSKLWSAIRSESWWLDVVHVGRGVQFGSGCGGQSAHIVTFEWIV